MIAETPLWHARTPDLPTLPDADLLALIRDDDMRALAELWSRYRRLAYAIALRTTARFDADDLVAETYARILTAFRRGNGPRENFRAYLSVTLRTVAARWAQDVPEIPLADISTLDEPSTIRVDLDPAVIVGVFEDPRLEQAFRSLPPRWQQILWSSAVEDVTVADLSVALDTNPATVAALAYRARRGLRREWERLQLTA